MQVERVAFSCAFCGVSFTTGEGKMISVTRIRAHFAGMDKEGINPCPAEKIGMKRKYFQDI